ncbi:MAG: PhnE/PtxC family ABC transporter permease, partial [Crocosphaera sp.]
MKLNTSQNQSKNSPPPRFRKPSFTVWLGIGILLAFFLHGLYISNLTPERIYKGFFRLGEFLAEAFPPKPDRLINIIKATIETFEMALVGTVFGAIFSLPLSFLAAKNTSPNGLIYSLSRGFITLLRVIPDLVWGLLFIVVVGLGAGAGILA